MAQSTPLRSVTVLVVENEALVRLELAQELAEMGLGILEASSADEAIAQLDAHPEIRILLTDIKMTRSIDGIRLAHHVRDRWPPIKIIVASGLVGTRFSDLPAGSIFLPKPYRPEDIKSALSYLTGRKRPLQTTEAF
jgi:CheY-like chemotaxis protein